MKRTLSCLLLAATLGAGGCTTSPAAKQPKEAEVYVLVEETGSRVKRRVPVSQVNSNHGTGVSPLKTVGGEALNPKGGLGDAITGP